MPNKVIRYINYNSGEPYIIGATEDSLGNNIAETYATKTELNGIVAAADAMVFKGTLAGAATTTYTPAANRGDTYKVSAAGLINGERVEIGDILICATDSTVAATSSNVSTVKANWAIIQNNVDGAVFKSTNTFTDGQILVADGTNGKIKTSGYTTGSFLPLGGGTLTGVLNLNGVDINLKTSGTSSDDSGDIAWFYGNGQEKMRIWSQNTYTEKAGPYFRVFKSDGTSLYSGTLALTDQLSNYLPLSGGTVTGTLVLSKTQDLSGTANNSPALIVGGAATAAHIEIDANEIQAKSNGTTATDLYINNDGGTVYFGATTDATSSTAAGVKVAGGLAVKKKIWAGGELGASSNNNTSSQLIISSSDTGAGGNVALELWRGTNASWQIGNEGGNLHFRTNYTTAKQSTYSVDAVQIAYNTGNVDIKGSVSGRQLRYGLDLVAKPFALASSNANNSWGGEIYYDAGANDGYTRSQWYFKQWSWNATKSTTPLTKYEVFYLPNTTSGLTENHDYAILTTKSTISVAQGGTGATTFTSGNVLVGAGTGAITTIAKTNANTANTLVQRDGSGNFSAGTITATLNGTATMATLLKPISTTTTASASSWNIPSGSKQVWGQRFSDSTLTYTPSGGSATTITDTGDWTMWLTPSTTSNMATLNMRIDGTYYGSFSGDLNGNATSATSATKATQDGDGNVFKNTYLKLVAGTIIPASSSAHADLNAPEWQVTGTYAVSVSGNTLYVDNMPSDYFTSTNSVGGGHAFTLNVYAPLASVGTASSGNWLYRTQEIIPYNNQRYRWRRMNSTNGSGTWGFGNWVRQDFTDTKVNVVARGTTKAYLLADTTAPTSTAAAHTAVAETAVYLDTTAGKLVATSFAGNGSALTNLNGSNIVSGTVPIARIPTGTTSTTVALGDHTHTASLVTDTGTSTITLASGGKYKLTAGGSSVIFTMPTVSASDINVTNTLETTTKYYVTGTTSATTNTGTQSFDTGIYATTVAGELNATQYKVNEAVTLQYSSTTESLDFIFA